MFTFGSDPEFMLKKGRMRSAIGIIPGSKHERHDLGEHQCYYDNVLAECAVKPAGSKEETIANFRDCLQRLSKLVAPHKLVCKAAHQYHPDELQHEEAKKIGCDPEYCAYSLSEASPSNDTFKDGEVRLRTAGGHIHLGNELLQEDEFAPIYATKMLDLFLAVPAVFLDGDPTARKRKELYGKAGRFRLPEHGVEYRSLSNFWLISPQFVGLVYDICEFVLEFLAEKRHFEFWTIDQETLESDDAWNAEDFDPATCHRCTAYDVDGLRTAIDTHNRAKAKKYNDFAEDFLPSQIQDTILELMETWTADKWKTTTLTTSAMAEEWSLTSP